MTANWSPASPALLVGKRAKVSGYPANFHVRNFLDCVKSRGQTRANADAACHSHITCHAANIALFLDRKLNSTPSKTSSSATSRPTGSAPKPCANPGGSKQP